MDEPFDRLHALVSLLGEDRFDEVAGVAGAPPVRRDRYDHQVPMSWHRITVLVEQPGVRSHSLDGVVVHGYDDAPVLIGCLRVSYPPDESVDDLGDFAQPRRRSVANVEDLQRRLVIDGRITQDHEPEEATGPTQLPPWIGPAAGRVEPA